MDMELAVKPLDQSVITETGMQMGFAPDEFPLEDPIVHTAPIRIDARVQTQGGLRIFYNYGMLVFGDMAIYTSCKNNTFNGMALPAIAVMEEDGNCKVIREFGYEDFKGRLA